MTFEVLSGFYESIISGENEMELFSSTQLHIQSWNNSETRTLITTSNGFFIKNFTLKQRRIMRYDFKWSNNILMKVAKPVKLGYNELGYNELGYNELGYNEPECTEKGKCRLTNEYRFLIGCWYYDKNILSF